ncbi:tryptophan 7-halogenase [Amycolatopsis minnesotensis]|uniref:NAD(P)/FAD-dependent oxidoreductase n=1 Tax=Amycolatopsis minnesotensis TaxID=337894 RepID=A0ABN2QW24_9PSEU
MQGTETEEFDVVVVGGGPAGSTVATLVAKQGHRVLLLEKEVFPRYQIGESLLPPTVHGICGLLGVTEEVQRAGFQVKLGATLRWGANPDLWTFRFGDNPEVPESNSYSFQVERMKFDQILLENAQRCGVDVRQNAQVTSTVGGQEDEGHRVRGVRYTDAGGREHEISAAFVVDASGNKSRIHKQVSGGREYSDFFRNIALFGYFKGGKRAPAPNQGNILSIAFDSGWFWYIPLTDELTSVGAVVRADRADRVRGDREGALRGLIAECPLVRDYLAGTELITEGTYGRIRVRKDYSYYSSRFWWPGMVLVGDAACFVDPVMSSGVHLATYSGLLAARSINSALAGSVTEEAAFREFESRYQREYAMIYEFLVFFYNAHVDEKSYFWQAKKLTGFPASELQAFVTLVGGRGSGDVGLVSDHSAGDGPAPDAAAALADAASASETVGTAQPSGTGLDEELAMSAWIPYTLPEREQLWLPEALRGFSERDVGELVPAGTGLTWEFAKVPGAGR